MKSTLGTFLALALSAVFYVGSALATPPAFTYQGRIVKADGSPLEFSAVSFEFRITNPTGSCVLYREQKNGVDMTNSKGVFDTPIGEGTKLFPTNPSFSLLDAFDNSAPLNCEGGATYTPLNNDGRLLRVQFHDGSGWKSISPDNVIRSVPYSSYATKSASSSMLGTKTETDFFLKNSIPLCSSSEFLTSSSTGVLSCAPGGSGSTGTAGGDLTGNYPNPSVAKIQNISIVFSAIAGGQYLKYNGSQWVNSVIASSEISGLNATLSEYVSHAQLPPNCSAGQTLTFSSPTSTFSCSNISINGSQVTGDISGKSVGFTGSLQGDVSGSQGTTVVNKIKGIEIAGTTPSSGNFLKFDGSVWTPTSLTSADLPSGDINISTPVPGTPAGGRILQGSSPLIHTYSGTGTTGKNIFVGIDSGNTTMAYSTAANNASFNSALGTDSMGGLTTGRSNVAVGSTALAADTSGSYNVAVGAEAMSVLTTGGWSTGVGYKALGATTTGGSNSALGAFALAANTTGVDNVSVGASSMLSPTTARYNAAFGAYSLGHALTGDSNTAIGHAAMQNKSGTLNTVIGKSAAGNSGLLTGAVVVGAGAGAVQSGSTGNILLGYQAGDALTSGSFNILIGYDIDAPSASTNNSLNIGNMIFATNLGTGSTTGTGNVGIGVVSPTEKLDVAGKVKATEFCIGASCINAWPSGGGSLTAGSVGTTELADSAVTPAKLETVSGLAAGSYGSATAIPSLTVDAKGRVTAISTNTITGLPAASGVSGKFLKSNGTVWSGQDILFSDIKNSIGGSAFNVASCAANQTVAWSSLTDSFTCQVIGSLPASSISTGTLDIARLPAAVTDGIWNASSGDVYRSTGSVGVGTTSPNQILQLHEPSATSSLISYTNSSTGSAALDGSVVGIDATGSLWLWNQENLPVILGTNNGERMRIDQSGKVGIGTTNPTAKLHVEDSGTEAIRVNSASAADREIVFSTGGIARAAIIGATSTTEGGSNAGSDFQINTYSDAGTYQATPFFIKRSSGNVGIGTLTPQRALHVTTAGSAEIVSESTAIGSGVVGRIWRTRIDPSSGNFNFDAMNGAMNSGNTAMTMLPGGNIGIGTTTPSQKLEVNGAIRTSQSATDCVGGWSCTGYFWDMSVASIYYSGLTQRSDRRLKENITTLDENYLDRLDYLRPVTYTWKDSKNGQGLKFGLIAQEVESVWPEIVSTADDAMKTKSVDYTQLISPLLKQAQDIRKFNREVQSVIQALEKSNLEKDKEIADLKLRLERIEEALKRK